MHISNCGVIDRNLSCVYESPCSHFLFQKSDPAQFLRIYGRPTKIHLDTAVALAAEAPQSMYVCQYFFLGFNCLLRYIQLFFITRSSSVLITSSKSERNIAVSQGPIDTKIFRVIIDRMPWPGDQNIMIDRFDVRASLDYIPELKPHEKE